MAALNYQLALKETELMNITKEHNELKIKYNNLEKEFSDLKTTYYLSVKAEKNVKTYTDIIENLEKEVKKLKDEIVEREIGHENSMRDMQIKYERELNSYKIMHENMTNKLEAVHAIERLSDKQQMRILELEEEIKQMESDGKGKLVKNQLKNEMKFTDLKKKMMDHIKETQKNVTELNMRHMDVSTKLTLLQNHQLLIELEYQSQQIEELLKKKENLEKRVFELQRDLDVHKEVEIVLGEKNKKYAEMLKNLANDKNLNENPMLIKSDSKLSMNTQIRDFNLNTFSDKKIKQLEQLLKKKENDYKLMKTNYDLIFERVTKYEKKYAAIYELFDNGLKHLYEDEEMKNSKEIYVNIEEIKKDNFSSLNSQQKYSVLMIFMKHLLPLVNLAGLEDSDKFTKTNLQNVKLKCHFKKKENKAEDTQRPATFNHTTYSQKVKLNNSCFGMSSGNGFFPRDMVMDILYPNSKRKPLFPNYKIQNKN